jgi:hypothetical protein
MLQFLPRFASRSAQRWRTTVANDLDRFKGHEKKGTRPVKQWRAPTQAEADAMGWSAQDLQRVKDDAAKRGPK